MADVLKFDGITFLPETPKSVLKKAQKWEMDRCVIIGFDKNNEMVFGGSFADAPDILMLLELAKKFVLEKRFAREIC